MIAKFILPTAFLLLMGIHPFGASYIYSQGTWISKTALPAAGRITAVAFSIGNKGYLGTGKDATGNLDDFWEYDPSVNSWAQKANFGGGPRSFAVGFSIGNNGYMGTGTNGTIIYKDFWKYDPLFNTWTQVADVGNIARMYASGFSLSGIGFIGTGYGYNGTTGSASQDFWKYNPVNNTWIQLGDFPGGPRLDIDRACFVICDKAYWGGGGNSTGWKDDLWEYTPATDTWIQKANIPVARGMGAAGFSICGKGFIGFGISKNDLWMYDPLTDSWSAVTSLPAVGRYDLPSFVINNKAYIGTGGGPGGSNNYLSDLWEFTSDTCTNISLSASSTTLCPGSSVTLSASGGNSYSWSNGYTDNLIVVFPTSTTTYIVIGTDICGSDTLSVTITVSPSPVVTISTNTTICSGQSATLSASGGGTYLWSTSATTSSISITPTTTTTYSVIVSIASCTDTATVTVTASPGITAIQSASLCSGSTYTLPGGTLVSTGGTYIDTLVSKGGCDSIITTNLTENPNPTAGAFSNVTITQGQSTTLTATGGGMYQWSPAAGLNCVTCANPVVTASPLWGAGGLIYCVTVTDTNNCTDTACVTVFIESIDCSNAGELYLPNAFSPNNDGENDKLHIYYGTLKCIKNFKLVIYNRWGERVFETTNPTAQWDGSYGSTPVITSTGRMEGTSVFVYYMEATFTSGDKIIKKGSISLIR